MEATGAVRLSLWSPAPQSVAQAQQRSERPEAPRMRFNPYAVQWGTYNPTRDQTAFHGHFVDPWNDPRSNDASSW